MVPIVHAELHLGDPWGKVRLQNLRWVMGVWVVRCRVAWVAWLVGSQGLALGVVLVKQSGCHWSP